MKSEYIIFIIVIIVVLFLVVCENLAHDNAPGRRPTHRLIPPNEDDDFLTRVRKIRQMIHDNSKFIIWRQAFILALLLPFPIVYFLKGKLPSLFEFMITGLIIFIGVYFSYIWLWSRYFYPNTARMEKELFIIEKNIRNGEKI